MIEISTSAVFTLCSDGVIRGVLFVPGTCACGKTIFFVINRDGRSRCMDCDAEYCQRLGAHARG